MAAFDLSLDDWVGLVAGALVLAVGAFVLAARPTSTLHRLFFVLALMDGASTILFGLALAATSPGDRAYYWGTYYYHFLAFVALLAVFGIEFPKPPARPITRVALHAATVALAVGTAVAYALDHRAFSSQPFVLASAGNLVGIAFVLATAALVLRLVRHVIHERSESHRRQAAYVLGGMTLAYVPFPATVTIQALASSGLELFVAGHPAKVLAHWTYLAATAVAVFAMLLVGRAWKRTGDRELSFVLGCQAGVVGLCAALLLFPTLEAAAVLRSFALLAYPVLLGFAIVRYEVFDIDKKLRRATTVSLLAAGMAATFVVGESLLEGLLQDRVFGGISSEFLSNSIAAVVAAGLGLPVFRGAQRVSAKVIPELSTDELRVRKLEIYRHSLAGAYADGILKEGESRTLSALREALGITQAEHEALVGQVVPA